MGQGFAEREVFCYDDATLACCHTEVNLNTGPIKMTHVSRRFPAVCSLFVLCWSELVSAQKESASKPPANQGYQDAVLSMGPMAGFFRGCGGKVRVGSGFGVEASVGAGLLVTHYSDLNKSGSLFAQHSSFFVGVPLRATAVPFVRVWRETSSKVDLSIGPSVQFDSILGGGLGVAALVEVGLSRTWSLDLDWGAGYFPRAEDRLVSSRRVSPNADFDFPPGLQWGLDVGISYRL